jgi:hypothetical protein
VVPSGRALVPSIAALTPLPGVGFDDVVNGRHVLAQAPKQVLFSPLSFSNMYSVCPVESTRIVPSPVSPAATVAAPALEPDAFLVVDRLLVLVLSPQPANSSAGAASKVRARVRRLMNGPLLEFYDERRHPPGILGGRVC